MNRSRALERLSSETFDVLVIGGGITGAGVALDSATRGLNTGLIEARDWASGTSSRSSKLVHGGIRYLEQLNFSLVHEALSERGLLLQRLAPHLVRPVKLLYPLQTPVVERGYVGAGMLLYDLFARASRSRAGMRFHRHFSRKQLRRVAPGLKHDAFVGGLGYWDGQVDDARLVLSVVRTAHDHGAATANRTRLESLVREGGRVTGAVVRDLETNETITVRAKHIVFAGGVWTDDLLALSSSEVRPRVRASKGVHILVPKDRFDSHAGLLLRTPSSVLFVLPWGDRWIIGTTDTDWNLDKAHPAATSRDIDYLLEQANRVLETPLTTDDIVGVYAGLRPLLSGESEETSTLSREHTVLTVEPGVTMIAGGKLTTYRVMAQDGIDVVAPGTKSVTDQIVLRGGEGYAGIANRREQLAKRFGLSERSVVRLLQRHGADTLEVLALIETAPALSEPLPGTQGYLRAEVVYAVQSEGALHLDDVLARRTHLATEAVDRGLAAAPIVADLMAEVLGWSREQREVELSKYRARVEAEIASQREFSDEAADRVRTAAP